MNKMRLKRKSKEWKFLLPVLLLAGISFHSCTDEEIIDAPSWHQAVEQGDNALMRDAKALVESTQGEMSMPDMFKTLEKPKTRAAESTPQTLAAGSFTINWEAAQSFHEEDGTVLIIPLKIKQNMAIWRFTVINNKRKAEQTPMHSVLYVKKFNSTGYVMGRVFSYAPSRQYIKKHPKYKNEMDWYNPDHTDYSGLLLISFLEGNLSHGFNYENGHRQYTFRPNVHAHNHDHEHESLPVTRAVAVADSCQHGHAADNRIVTARSTAFNMRIVSSTSAISTYSFNNETTLPNCAICGKDPYYCDCLIIDGDVCDYCGKVPENCICTCEKCERKKTNCICCLVCQSYPCTCNSGSSSNSGSSGGGGGGGGSETPPENEEQIPDLPCYNPETDIYNPLTSMTLAPPNSWNIAGATFGYTRYYENGVRKFHQGIDLCAEVGTPIYAMADGVVEQVVTTQPNRIDNEYPSDYDGDKNDAGNRIKIKSTINEETVYFSYWHLRAWNPVGTDRNGKTLEKNSRVYAGDIIGYTGITGNASEDIPHLHLGTQNSDLEWINPTIYLNATVSTTNITITTPCD